MANTFTPLESLGGRFGTAVGQGIAHPLQQALDTLAQQKINQFAERQYSGSLQGLPGITPEIANFIAAQRPEDRKKVLQNLGTLMQLGSVLSPESNITQQAAIPRQAQAQQAPKKQLTAADFMTNPMVADLAQRELAKSRVLSQQPQQAAAPAPEQISLPKQKQGLAADQAKLLQDLFTSPQEKREQRKLELKEQQIATQEKAARFKATKEERKEIIQKAQSARQAMHDLNRLEELQESGNLDTPGYVEFLKRSGLDIPALMNPESEEFQKIAQNFVSQAKTYFGGRVSNFEVEQFLKTIPSLSQSPEGRKRVIANLKYLKRGDLEYSNALKEIVKENEGVPPYDLLEQIDDRIDTRIENVAKKFKEDISKPVPKAQNKLVTALQSVAGSILGTPGALIGKIGGIGSSIAGGAGIPPIP